MSDVTPDDGDLPVEPVPPAEERTVEPTKKSLRPWMFVAAIVAVLAGIAVVKDKTGSESETIKGVFVLFDKGGVDGSGADCGGSDGYDDIDAGAAVQIRDSKGDVIGGGSLTGLTHAEAAARLSSVDGTSAKDWEDTLDAGDGLMCAMGYDIDVPDEKLYVMEIAQRGEITYTHKELEDNHWVAYSNLGDT